MDKLNPLFKNQCHPRFLHDSLRLSEGTEVMQEDEDGTVSQCVPRIYPDHICECPSLWILRFAEALSHAEDVVDP